MSDIDRMDIRRLDGGLLLVFRELMRRRRTTAAAAQLGLSQSAVSHALSRLREIFDDPLFLRRPHGLDPTFRATELAPRIDALIELMGAALRPDASFDPAGSTRMFRLAATEYAVNVADGALVMRLRAAAPRAAFKVQFLRGYQGLEALHRGRIDLAVGRFEAAPWGLVREPLFEDRYCVVARRGHPRIDGSIDERLWRRIGHVFAAPDSPSEETIGPSVGEDAMPNPGEVATAALVPRWETALQIVAQSDAIATCSRRLAESEAARLGLQVLEPPFPGQPWTVSALRRDEPDPGLDWFQTLLTGG